MQRGEIRIAEARPFPALDRGASFGDQIEQYREVVVRQEPRSEHLAGAKEMREVGTAERRANHAAATLVERPEVASKPGVAQVQIAASRQRAAVASRTVRVNGVEHCQPAGDWL